jgi:hypothetical protein
MTNSCKKIAQMGNQLHLRKQFRIAIGIWISKKNSNYSYNGSES